MPLEQSDGTPWPGTLHDRWMAAEYVPGLVSVIIPTYNRASLVTEAMDSVAAQTYRPIELIVVDDGSTDGTAAAIERWRQEHATGRALTLRYVCQTNHGAPAARNLGLIESRGEFIQFLDSDDLLSPDKLQPQVRVLRAKGAGTAVYGPHWTLHMARRYRVVAYKGTAPPDPLRAWLRGWFAPSHALLWCRSDLVALGPWDESLHADQDGDLAMRFLLSRGTLSYCPSSWVTYRIAADQENHVSRCYSRDACDSMIRVARRVEAALIDRQQLDDTYRRALARRYYDLGRRFSAAHPDLTWLCVGEMLRLLPRLGFGREFLYGLLCKSVGLPMAERLFALARVMIKRPLTTLADVVASRTDAASETT